MSDVIINPDDFHKMLKTGAFGTEHIRIFGKLRSAMVADGEIIDITEFSHEMNFLKPAALMSKLWAELFPWGEDAVKGITFAERVYDMLTSFRKKYSISNESFAEFDFAIETYVEEVNSFDDVRVFKDGKAHTKIIKMWVAIHPGDTSSPVMTFGLRNASGRILQAHSR